MDLDLLRKAFQAEGTVGAKLGGVALQQLQRVDSGGDERPGWSLEAHFHFPEAWVLFHPAWVLQ